LHIFKVTLQLIYFFFLVLFAVISCRLGRSRIEKERKEKVREKERKVREKHKKIQGKKKRKVRE